MTHIEAIHTADYIEQLEQENKQMKAIAIELCDEIQNKERRPQYIHLLRVDSLINQLHQKLQDHQ